MLQILYNVGHHANTTTSRENNFGGTVPYDGTFRTVCGCEREAWRRGGKISAQVLILLHSFMYGKSRFRDIPVHTNPNKHKPS